MTEAEESSLETAPSSSKSFGVFVFFAFALFFLVSFLVIFAVLGTTKPKMPAEAEIFGNEAQFLALFDGLTEGPVKAEAASAGEAPRINFQATYPTGKYRISITKRSILTTCMKDKPGKVVKKIKDQEFILTVSAPDAGGLSTCLVKPTKVRYFKRYKNTSHFPDTFYDSEDETTYRNDAVISKIVSNMLSKQYSIVLNARGELIKAEVLKNAKSALPGELPSQFKAFVEKNEDDFLKGCIGLILPQKQYLPEGPVGPGAIWYTHGVEEMMEGAPRYAGRCRFISPTEISFYCLDSLKVEENPLNSLLPPEMVQANVAGNVSGNEREHGTVVYSPDGYLRILRILQKKQMKQNIFDTIVKRETRFTVERLD